MHLTYLTYRTTQEVYVWLRSSQYDWPHQLRNVVLLIPFAQIIPSGHLWPIMFLWHGDIHSSVMVLLFQIYQQLQSGRYIVKKSRRVIYCYLQISGGKKARGASFEKAFWGKTLAFLNQNLNHLSLLLLSPDQERQRSWEQMATLDRRLRQAGQALAGRSKLPQLVLGMSPNVGACLRGVAASLSPAFFLSLNSWIGLLMSFLCCQPEWGSSSCSQQSELAKLVGCASPTRLPSCLTLCHKGWLTAPEPCLWCQTKLPPLRNVHRPDDASPLPWYAPPPQHPPAAVKAAPPVGSSPLSIQRVRYHKFPSQYFSSSS